MFDIYHYIFERFSLGFSQLVVILNDYDLGCCFLALIVVFTCWLCDFLCYYLLEDNNNFIKRYLKK